jgi:hypothetical protein
MNEISDKETENLTNSYAEKLNAEIEKNRQISLVRESAKQKLVALGFSPNEIAAIMGEEMLDYGSGMI